MKSKVASLYIGGALTSLLGSMQVKAAPAPQEPPKTTAHAATEISEQTLEVKNVTSELMAWWLDPEHNEVPPLIKNSPQLKIAGAFGWESQNIFRLPDGIQKLTPTRPKNALLAVGTKEGLAELKDLIAFSDRPLRLVEIEAQLVEINNDELKAPFPEYKVAGRYLTNKPVMIPTSTIAPVLSNLILKRKATSLSTRKFLVLNRSYAQVVILPPAPYLVHYSTDPDLKPTSNKKGSVFMVPGSDRESVVLQIRPILCAANSDGDILSLSMALNRLDLNAATRNIGTAAQSFGGKSVPNVIPWNVPEILSYFKDNETAAFFNMYGYSQSPNSHQVLLVTPRLARLADNKLTITKPQP